MTASASKGGLLLDCAYWARADVPHHDEGSDATRVGNAVHALCEDAVRFGPESLVAEGAAMVAAKVHGADAARVRAIWANAREYIAKHRRIGWRAEVALAWDVDTDAARELPSQGHRDYSAATATEIPGTADVITWDAETLVIYDWKTGRSLDGYEGQMNTLALLGARAYGADRVRVVLVRFGEDPGDIEERSREVDALDLDALTVELSAQHAKARMLTAEPSPGPHCAAQYCPAMRACPATAALMRSNEATAPLAEVLSAAMQTPEDAGRVYLLTKRAKALLKMLDDRVKEIVIANGEAPTTPGKVLRASEQSREYFSADRIPPEKRDDVVNELRALGALKRSEWKEVREVKR